MNFAILHDIYCHLVVVEVREPSIADMVEVVVVVIISNLSTDRDSNKIDCGDKEVEMTVVKTSAVQKLDS